MHGFINYTPTYDRHMSLYVYMYGFQAGNIENVHVGGVSVVCGCVGGIKGGGGHRGILA